MRSCHSLKSKGKSRNIIHEISSKFIAISFQIKRIINHRLPHPGHQFALHMQDDHQVWLTKFSFVK